MPRPSRILRVCAEAALLLLIVGADVAQAANLFSRAGGGAWATSGTSSTTGCPGGVSSGTTPTAADNVTICSGDTVTMSGNAGAANSLNIIGTATCSQNRTTNVGAGGVTVSGDLAGASNGVL